MCREAAWAELAVEVPFVVCFSKQDVRIKIKIKGVADLAAPFLQCLYFQRNKLEGCTIYQSAVGKTKLGQTSQSD